LSAADVLRHLAPATALAVRGREAALRRRLADAVKSGADPRRLDEAFLQLVPFAGYARAINAFHVLREFVPAARPRRDLRTGRRGRGVRLCRRVYGASYGRLMKRMEGLHPDLAAWILEEGYGRVLSRPGLSGKERELLAVAALAALPGAGPQREAHERGARRLGATAREVREARYVAERAVRRGV
jgi:4-carboxymuconolactone decarboxylase